MTIDTERRVKNQTLRDVRLAMRMSQSEFAAAIRRAGDALGESNTCNKRLVQKWESGEHAVCRPNYRRALQAVTHLHYARLGFTDAPAATPFPSAAGLPVSVSTPATGAGAESSDRLRYALDRPGSVDRAVVELVEATTAHLFDREQHERARDLTGPVEKHVAHVAQLLSGARREELRRRLAATGAQAAALAGWLAFDQGKSADAQRHWDNALGSARYAGQGAAVAYVFMLTSYAAERRGDPAAGWQLAHGAIVRAPVDLRACAWGHVRAAQLSAALGDARTARVDLERAPDLGRELTGPHDGTAPWVRFLDTCVLAAMAAAVHVALGEHRAARDAADAAARLLGPTRVKWRAVALAEIARAAIGVRDVDRLVEFGTRAMDLTEHLEAGLARGPLRALGPALKLPLDTPASRALLARINSMPN